MVKKMKNCIGTTQTNPFNKIQNFGGFTDGDRGVFLASYFNAKKIILFGMDFGNQIGKFSNTKKSDRRNKVKKVRNRKRSFNLTRNNFKIRIIYQYSC